MAKYLRSNAWREQGSFDNPSLLWYAKGVGAMMARGLNEPGSWWFFAAIHGEYVTPKNLNGSFPDWKDVPAPPAVPTTPLPSTFTVDRFWNQCQHQSWYFPPWHRGYLIALEQHVRAAVISLGGPSTWALPYWNYLGGNNQNVLPPAFAQRTLPDGSPNPLYVRARFGPANDGNIFVQAPPVNRNCMSNDIYTGSTVNTLPPGFGGPKTGFWHSGGKSGNLESNPHNLVHVQVGGQPTDVLWGLMSDPGLAALDPIFYLHHCNIDRMWAVWNKTNNNPGDSDWLDGPPATGGRPFVMPTLVPDREWVYTPREMQNLSLLDYSYDDLSAAEPSAPVYGLTERLTRLGAPAAAAAARATAGAAMTADRKTELMGASSTAVPITGTGATTPVRLDPTVRRNVSASLSQASESALPDRVYIQLENVRGTRDATELHVYINVPDGENAADHPELYAGAVGLFGLRRASRTDGDHGGEGLTFILDITQIVDSLHLANALDTDALQVRIEPNHPVPKQGDVTVGRISVYREGQ